MIKPKPQIGKICTFAAKVKNGNYEYILLVRGIVHKKKQNDWYVVKLEDDWTGHIEYQDVHISHMYDFEWGGIMTTNPRRSRQIFDNLRI